MESVCRRGLWRGRADGHSHNRPGSYGGHASNASQNAQGIQPIKPVRMALLGWCLPAARVAGVCLTEASAARLDNSAISEAIANNSGSCSCHDIGHSLIGAAMSLQPLCTMRCWGRTAAIRANNNISHLFYSWSVTIPRRRTFMARSYRRLMAQPPQTGVSSCHENSTAEDLRGTARTGDLRPP